MYIQKREKVHRSSSGRVSPASTTATQVIITTALGEQLPTRVSVDNYFNELKNSWN